MRSRRIPAIAATMAACVLIATGCAASQEKAEAQLCESLADFRLSLAAVAELDFHSDVGDIRSAREDLNEAWRHVLDDAANVGEDRVDDIDDARDDLMNAMDGVDDDASLREARVEVSDEAMALVDSYDEALGKLDCASNPTGDPGGLTHDCC